MKETLRQIELGWYRGFELGFVAGIVTTLFTALIIKIFF